MNLVRTRLQHLSQLTYVNAMGLFTSRYKIALGIELGEPNSYTLNEHISFVREFQGMSHRCRWEVDLHTSNIPWSISYEQ